MLTITDYVILGSFFLICYIGIRNTIERISELMSTHLDLRHAIHEHTNSKLDCIFIELEISNIYLSSLANIEGRHNEVKEKLANAKNELLSLEAGREAFNKKASSLGSEENC